MQWKGHLLAWLSKEQSTGITIVSLHDEDGILLSDPAAINAKFALFYKTLYSSGVQYSMSDLDSCLGVIEFTTLDLDQQQPSCVFRSIIGLQRGDCLLMVLSGGGQPSGRPGGCSVGRIL